MSSQFTAVITGNVWKPQLLLDELCKAWQWVGDQLGGIRPIQWFAHPDSINHIKSQGVELKPEIEYAGFFPVAEFKEKLYNADMSIIPFNYKEYPETDIAKYSLPSRITEISAAGLPIFLMAGSRTETARYVTENGIGVSAAPINREQFRKSLLDFVKNRELRAKCGCKGRELAEREFDIIKYRSFLYNRLATLSSHAVTIASAEPGTSLQ